MLKTDKKNELTNSIMSIVQENIEEENKDIIKDKDKDININDNINEKDNLKENVNINNSIKDISNNNNDKIDEKKESDPLINHMNIQGNITEEEINNSSKIILEEINGNLFKGEKIEINAGGMVGGRGKKDGFAIFGQKNNNEKEDEKNSNNNNNNSFKPDFELNYNESLSYPYIFAIYYKKEEKAYYIRAFSGKGSGNKILFIKLKNNDKFILKQRELISAGNKIFQIDQINDNALEIINLEKKRHHHNSSSSNAYVFKGNKHKTVTLGRSQECDYSFPKDKSFSRFQTTFEYDENKKEWSIIDGKDKKSSTNGTWILGSHSFLIKNEMMVEILNSKILIKEILAHDNEENSQIK